MPLPLVTITCCCHVHMHCRSASCKQHNFRHYQQCPCQETGAQATVMGGHVSAFQQVWTKAAATNIQMGRWRCQPHGGSQTSHTHGVLPAAGRGHYKGANPVGSNQHAPLYFHHQHWEAAVLGIPQCNWLHHSHRSSTCARSLPRRVQGV